MSMCSGRYLTFQADDLGLAPAFNEGILDAYQGGILTGVTLRTNGSAFEDAVYRVIPECPDVSVGIHLNVVEGRSQRPNITKKSQICGLSGEYTASFAGLLKAHILRESDVFVEIEDDYRNQIETALQSGIHIDHVSSHQHTHAIPSIFRIACKLSVEYKIPFVRLMKEPFYFAGSNTYHAKPWYLVNLVKHRILNSLSIKNQVIANEFGVHTNRHFIGVIYTGHMNRTTVLKGLTSLRHVESSVVEVLLHPCKVLPEHSKRFIAPYLKDYASDSSRSFELDALKDPNVKSFIQENGWILKSYSQLEQMNWC